MFVKQGFHLTILRTLILIFCKFGWLSSCWSLSLLNYWLFAFSLLACDFFCFYLSVCLSVCLCIESCGSDRQALTSWLLLPPYIRSWSMLRCSSVGNKEVEIKCKLKTSPIIVHAKQFTSVTMDNPSRNQMQQTKAVKISLRWPRLRCWGNKSTTPVTTPSIPTNLMRKKP